MRGRVLARALCDVRAPVWFDGQLESMCYPAITLYTMEEVHPVRAPLDSSNALRLPRKPTTQECDARDAPTTRARPLQLAKGVVAKRIQKACRVIGYDHRLHCSPTKTPICLTHKVCSSAAHQGKSMFAPKHIELSLLEAQLNAIFSKLTLRDCGQSAL